jgi:hypothetical protein
MRKIDFLFLFVIFFNVTELYRPMGVILGMGTSSTVTTFSLLSCILYLGLNIGKVLDIMKYKLTFHWVVLVFVFPTLMMVLQFFSGFLDLGELVYWVSFSAHFALLLLGSIVLVSSLKPKYFIYMYIFCIFTVVVGFLINFTNYDFIRQVLAFSNIRIAVQDQLFRVLGFFQHPNAAAISIVFYFVTLTLFFPVEKYNKLVSSAMILIMIILVIITGSRTSMVLAIIVSFLYLRPILFSYVIKNGETKLNVSVPYVLSWVCIVFGLTISLYMMSSMDFGHAALNRIGERIGSISSGGDLSLDFRKAIIPVYFDYISQNPLLGYGPQFVVDRLADGVFFHVSQNAFVEWAMKYGIFYSLYYFYVLFITYKTSMKYSATNINFSRVLKLIVIILCLVSFSINDVFWYRSISISLGVILGYYYLFCKTQMTNSNRFEIS